MIAKSGKELKISSTRKMSTIQELLTSSSMDYRPYSIAFSKACMVFSGSNAPCPPRWALIRIPWLCGLATLFLVLKMLSNVFICVSIGPMMMDDSVDTGFSKLAFEELRSCACLAGIYMKLSGSPCSYS